MHWHSSVHADNNFSTGRVPSRNPSRNNVCRTQHPGLGSPSCLTCPGGSGGTWGAWEGEGDTREEGATGEAAYFAFQVHVCFVLFFWGGRDGEVKGKNVWTPECSSIMRSLRFGIQSPWLIVAFFVWPGGVLRKHFSSHIGFGGRFRVLVFVWGGVGVQWFTAPVGMQAVGAYGSECLKVNSLCHLTSTAPTGKS